MISRRDRPTAAVRALLVAGAGVALAWAVLRVIGTGDFQPHGVVAGDNAGPALDALVHGHLAEMVSRQPLMGLVSILWRAPFVGLAEVLGSGGQTVYEVGSLACLASGMGLVVWLACGAASAMQLAAAAIAAWAIVAGPSTLQAIQVGHPEEILATVLATGAVVSATAGRRGWAAALLGLAVGTKQWALLATPCVLLSLPGARAAVAAKATLLAGAAAATLPLLSPAAFARANTSVGGLKFAEPFSLWWPAGSRGVRPISTVAHILPFGMARAEAAAIALIFLVAVIWVYGRRVAAGGSFRFDGLALLALLGLVRCISDPDPLTYNFVAVVIPLAAWEAGRLRRLPVATALTCGALGLLPSGVVAMWAGEAAPVPAAVLNLVSIGGAAALGCYLVRCAFRPRAANRRLASGRYAPPEPGRRDEHRSAGLAS